MEHKQHRHRDHVSENSVKQKPIDSDHVSYTCPMHPDVRQSIPGDCPKCGMAVEAMMPASAASTETEYVCPMHPEIVRSGPGNCPICGMSLEPRGTTAEEENPELVDMTRRFWISAVFAVPLFVLAMLHDFAPHVVAPFLAIRSLQWLEFALATPVVLWCGWPFFQRGWASIINRSPNMFTLIALGISVAWTYSVIATFLPDLFPESMRNAEGAVAVYNDCGRRHEF